MTSWSDEDAMLIAASLAAFARNSAGSLELAHRCDSLGFHIIKDIPYQRLRAAQEALRIADSSLPAAPQPDSGLSAGEDGHFLITEDSDPKDVIRELGEGVIGAVKVMIDYVTQFGEFNFLRMAASLEQQGWRGSKLWLIYKELCDGSITKFRDWIAGPEALSPERLRRCRLLFETRGCA